MNNKGLILVEILVVVTIIGILAGVLLVVFGPARIKGKDTKISSSMLELQQLAESIYLDDGSYNNFTTANAKVAVIENDLNRLGSSPLTIEKSSTQFCAFAPLSSKNSCPTPRVLNFCVDSWNTAKKVGVASVDYCMDNFVCRSYFDFDNDGMITTSDINEYTARYWGCSPFLCLPPKIWDPRADINGDRLINILDIVILFKSPHMCD